MNKVNTNKILIPVDFSKTSLYAVKYAASLVQSIKGELILLHVHKKKDLIDLLVPALKPKEIKKVMDHITERLEKLAGEMKKKYGVKVIPMQADGSITSKIVDVSKKSKVGLIVMGTHGKDSTNDLFLGSNAYRVLTKSKVPVMTVLKGTDKMGFSRILIPIDASEHTRQKVDSAVALAARYGAELHVLGLYHKNEEDYYRYKLDVILGQIKKMAEGKKVKCFTEVQLSKNHAVTTLDHAKHIKADMIIAMTDQNAEFSRIILGTYIHQIINESSVPVICIPPDNHDENIENTMGGMW